MRNTLLAAAFAVCFVILPGNRLVGASVEPVNKTGKGIALKGHDPVAYFKQNKPVKGSQQFTHEWMNATWLFESKENRDAFAANPSQFAPQYGGYCAWAVSKNYTADTDPEAWKIVDGKLYLNYSKRVQRMWEKELSQRIEVADRNWASSTQVTGDVTEAIKTLEPADLWARTLLARCRCWKAGHKKTIG